MAYDPYGQQQPQYQQPQYPAQQDPQPYPQQWPQPYGQPPAMAIVPKSPGVALLLSLLIPGVGSIYAGNVALGVIILVASLIADVLCLVVIGFVLAPAVWIWGMIAAYLDAQRWNRERGIIS